MEDLCDPAVIGPNKDKAIRIALRKYKDLLGNDFNNNTLIVIDFASAGNGTDTLAELAKEIRDYNYPVRFVFIASEARAPAIFQRRVEQVRLVESDDTLAQDYLQNVVRIKNQTQIQEIVKFTGAIFKYLSKVQNVWPRDRQGTNADVQGKKFCFYY